MNTPCFYRISVKGIVIDDNGRFLLAKETNGKWSMLGGGLEHGEQPIEGLKREVMEEAGLEITYVSKTPLYFIVGPSDRNIGENTANIIYEIKLNSLNFKPSDECQELKFFNVKEAQDLKMYPKVKQFLNEYDSTIR